MSSKKRKFDSFKAFAKSEGNQVIEVIKTTCSPEDPLPCIVRIDKAILFYHLFHLSYERLSNIQKELPSLWKKMEIIYDENYDNCKNHDTYFALKISKLTQPLQHTIFPEKLTSDTMATCILEDIGGIEKTAKHVNKLKEGIRVMLTHENFDLNKLITLAETDEWRFDIYFIHNKGFIILEKKSQDLVAESIASDITLDEDFEVKDKQK
jgi:hypothetical protein